MTNMIRFALAALLIAAVIPGDARAQSCCGRVALPTGGLEQRGLFKSQFEIRLSYENSDLDRTLLGEREITDPLDRRNRTQSVNLAVTYGLTDRISFSGVLPVRWTRLSILDDRVIRQTSGIGDIYGIVKYRLLAPISPRRPELSVGFGLKAPTGEHQQSDQYGIMSVGQQVGSGAFDFILTGQYNQAFGKVTAFFNASYRIPTRNDRGYLFGDYFHGSAKGAIPILSEYTILTAGLEIGIAGWDNFTGDVTDPYGGGAYRDSGGQWVYFTPGIVVQLNRLFSAQFETALPIYDNVNGKQISESVIWKLAVSYFHP